MKRLIDNNHVTVYLWPSHHNWILRVNQICIGPVEITIRYWFIKRMVWRVIGRLLWVISPRLRDEYGAFQKRVWDSGCACVDFPEWIAGRVFPDVRDAT